MTGRETGGLSVHRDAELLHQAALLLVVIGMEPRERFRGSADGSPSLRRDTSRTAAAPARARWCDLVETVGPCATAQTDYAIRVNGLLGAAMGLKTRSIDR